MATFNDFSISNFASCIKKNHVLLTKLFVANEVVYYSDIADKVNVTELQDYHIVDILGKEILSLTPVFRKMISTAFSIVQLVSDHDVLRYKEKLEKDIEDCISSRGDKAYECLQYVKSDLGEIMMVMSTSVDELNDAVEKDFRYLDDYEIKKRHLERYLNLNNKLRSLRGEIDKILFGSEMKRLQADFNDSDLDFLVTTCFTVFSTKGADLLKLLPTIRAYLSEIRRRYAEIDKIHRLMALKTEGTLDRIENSNLKEYLSTDLALWHETGAQHPFYIHLDFYRESPLVRDALQRAKIQYDLTLFKSQPAGPVDSIYSKETVTDRRKANPRELMKAFTSSGKNLFEFIEGYDFGTRLTLNERINYFIYFACLYHSRLEFSDEYINRNGRDILVMYPKV